MAPKIALYLCSHRLTAGLWQGGHLQSFETFENDDAGHADFLAFIHRYRRIPIYLIADLVDEDYRIETAPHTSGRARHDLLERKLGALFRTALYRAAQFIARERGGRRDDVFLLVALTNTEKLKPWNKAMSDQSALLAGVYLMPMLSQTLMHRLQFSAPNLLLIDAQASGLRQSYFHDGQLFFSRLAPDFSYVQDDFVQSVLIETEKTRRYLLSQHLIVSDTKLSVLIRMSDDPIDAICGAISHQPNMECQALDTEKLSSDIGIDQKTIRQFPELLYMQTLVMTAAPVSLAPAAECHAFLLHRLRQWMTYATAAVLFGGLSISVMNFTYTLSYQRQLRQTLAHTMELERQYKVLSGNLPSSPLPAEDLKLATTLSDDIAAHRRTPQRLMEITSAALEHVPEIRLQRLHWKHTNDPNAIDDNPAKITISRRTQNQDQNDTSGALYELGFIDGEIRSFSGDYRAAMGSVNHLTEWLESNPEVESASVVQPPVNVSAYSSLHGSTREETAQQMPVAQFKLRLRLKAVITP